MPKPPERRVSQPRKAPLNTPVSLSAPYPASYQGAPQDKISVQYAVMEVVKQAGLRYDFDTSRRNTDPICRQFIMPNIQNQPCRQALTSILRPVGLTYRITNGVVVLEK